MTWPQFWYGWGSEPAINDNVSSVFRRDSKANTAGVTLSSELRSRSVLYSIRPLSIIRLAWAMVMNQLSFRRSSRDFQLKSQKKSIDELISAASGFRGCRHPPERQTLPLPPFHHQSRFPVQTVGPLTLHQEALTAQQDVDPLVAIAALLLGELAGPLHQPLRGRPTTPVAIQRREMRTSP